MTPGNSPNSKATPPMNATDSVSLFSSSRNNRSLGLVLAAIVFALVGVGGSGAIARNFVTAGGVASAAAPVSQLNG